MFGGQELSADSITSPARCAKRRVGPEQLPDGLYQSRYGRRFVAGLRVRWRRVLASEERREREGRDVAISASNVILTDMVDRPHLIYWLRVAVSAVCVVLCLGLIGLWVRSYLSCDSLIVGVKKQYELVLSHNQGVIMYSLWDMTGATILYASTQEYWFIKKEPVTHFPGWLPTMGLNDNGRTILCSYCFPLFIVATCGFVSWFPWSTRFSLRTLLIVTTVVGLMLGAVVWLTR